jgi:hypothetical protein
MSDQRRPCWAERIQVEREARGWGKWEMGRRLMDAVGIDPAPSRLKSLGRQMLDWEKGRHFPRDWADAYATVLGIPCEELFASEEATAPHMGTVEGSPTPDTGDDDVKRRAALQLLAALGSGAAVPPGVLEELLSGLDHVLSHKTDIEEWERIVDDYGRQIYRQPFDVLIPALTADIVAVGELLKEGRSSHEQAGLLRVSTVLSGVLAETLSSMGDDRAARRTWSTARRAADASGDRTLRVWVRGRAAQHASWAGSSRHAVMAMVNEAGQIADGTPSSGVARAYAASACMAAFSGDKVMAHGSLDKLKRTFDELPNGSSEPTVLDFQESQLRWNEAYVRTTLGDKGALAAVEDAHALYPPTARAPIANLFLMRAIDMINDGEVRQGLDLAVTSLNGRPRPVMATRQLIGQILSAIPDAARTLPAGRELRALTGSA